MFYTYIIFSESSNLYYVGSTRNVDNRVKRHNLNHSKATKGRGPWQIIKVYSFETRAEAMKLEMKIKKRGIKRFLNDF